MDKVKVICDKCDGRGYISMKKYREGKIVSYGGNGCPYYTDINDGVYTGKPEYEIRNEDRLEYVEVRCSKCKGRGYIEVTKYEQR